MNWQKQEQSWTKVLWRNKSRNYSARAREGENSFAVRTELSLLSGGMEGLWRAQVEAKRKVKFRRSEKRGDKASNGVVC